MAILFTQADGSDQHYDTYEEFEQAMILMKRLSGEKVPQDLMDEVAENRTPVSDEIEIPEKEPKFKVGDKVKVINNLSGGHPEETVGVVDSVGYSPDEGSPTYGVDSEHGSPYNYTLYHDEDELEYSEETTTEFRSGDIVRVTQAFEDRFGGRVSSGAVYNYDESLGIENTFVGTVFLEDNLDKIELVCRAQDRLDK